MIANPTRNLDVAYDNIGVFITNLRAIALVGLSLAYMLKATVFDEYMGVRVFWGPIGYLVDKIYIWVFVFAAMLSLATLRDLLKGRMYLSISFALICFILLRLWLAMRSISVGVSATDELSALVLILALAFFIAGVRFRGMSIRCDFVFISQSFLVAGLVYQALNILQYYIDSSVLMHRGRMFGISTHANEFGIINVVVFLSAAYVLVTTRSVCWRILSCASIPLSIAFVYFSGSRTAALGLVIALCAGVNMISVRLWTRFLNAAIVLLSIIVSGWLLWHKSQQADEVRLVSVEDTRSSVFREMLSRFYENPYLGNPIDAGGTSNAPLYAAASGGLPALLLILAVLFIPVTKCFNLAYYDYDNASAWFFKALGCVIILTSMLSGYPLEVIQFPILALLLWLLKLSNLSSVRRRAVK